MKVIFLDWDGVLNSVRYHMVRHATGLNMHEGSHKPCLDPEAIKVLNHILESVPSAVVVVTSTWRLGVSRVQLAAWMRDAGFTGTVLGMTPSTGKRRGYDIQEWLDKVAWMYVARLGPVTHFVIVDDDTDMEHLYDKLVKIDDQDGLTADYIPAILKHLEG